VSVAQFAETSVLNSVCRKVSRPFGAIPPIHLLKASKNDAFSKWNKFRPLNAREYIVRLAAQGRYNFASGDAQSALGVSAAAAKLALNRLAKQGEVASPVRGFYIIVPPEYRSLGSLPADQFIPGLMRSQCQVYYAGLLSAAQYHGAAHHRPQEFQVMLVKNRRPIQCGAVRVAFMARKRIAEVSNEVSRR